MGVHETLRTVIVPTGDLRAEGLVSTLGKTCPHVEGRLVHNEEDLVAAIDGQHWDLILAGFSRDDFDAIDALGALKADVSAPPVVVIAGAIGEEAAAECFRAGAADFVRVDRIDGLRHVIRRVLADAASAEVTRARTCHVVSSLPQTVAETDLDGYLTFVNDNGFDMFGYRPGDLDRGVHVTDVIAPVDRERLAERVRAILQGQQMGSGEYLALRKDGTTFHALINSAPMVRDGKPAGLRSIVVDISDRVEAEEALRQSEERYRTLVENMHEGIWAVDADGVTTFVNERISEMLGYEAEEIIGRHFWEFQNADDASVAREDHGSAFGGKPRTVPRRFVTSSGEEREALVRPVPLFDEQGQLRAAFATVVDVTERRRMERERRHTLMKFRTLFDNLSDPVFIHNLKGRFVEVNDAACARLGYTHGELLRMGPSDIDIAGYAGAVDRRVQQVLDHGETCFQAAHVTTDGEVIPVELSARLIDYDGEPHIVSIARDISSRIEAEHRFRTIFDAAGTAMCIVDRDGTITDVNWRFNELSGYQADEVEDAMHWTEFVEEDDVERLCGYGNMRRGGAEATPNNYEFGFVDRDGTVKSVLCSVAIIPGTNRTVASLLDISERHELETQLRQAQKMTAVGDLAGGVAHDFNNNLTAILVSVQLLRYEEALSPGVEEAMDVIEAAAKRSASLTRQLLAFGRKQFMDPEALSVPDLVREMRPMLKRVIPECITIATRFGSDIPDALMDRSQLEHVAMNLVVNARDAMNGGGTLTIGVDMVHDDDRDCGVLETGEYVELSISDTGIGIPEETQARIFEPFFTTKTDREGSGLGLSTAYGIVRQSGGDITVSSVPGAGTTFHVFLPVAEDAPSAQSELSGGEIRRHERAERTG